MPQGADDYSCGVVHVLTRLFTGRTKAEWRALEQKVDLQRIALAELSTKLSTTAGAALAVRINELEAALETLQRSNRRELGRLWKLVGIEKADEPKPAETADQVRARLRQQHGLPKQPNGSN